MDSNVCGARFSMKQINTSQTPLGCAASHRSLFGGIFFFFFSAMSLESVSDAYGDGFGL